jgi:hypothetical protein
MANITNELREWTVNYVKHKDMILNKIEDIKENSDSITVKYDDKEVLFLIIPHLTNLNTFFKHEKDEEITLVILNTKENFNLVVKNWKKLSEYTKLKIMFVNPESSLEKKWIISPHFHSKICDETSLRSGLMTMFESVSEY